MSNQYHECATAMGEMVMEFQTLENSLLELFASLNNGEDQTIGLIVGSTLSFQKLCDVVDAVSKHQIQDDELSQSISDTLK